MSRSSKGYADFFPTAPSVLQQKRTKTIQHRKRQKSSAIDGSDHAPASTDFTDTIRGEGHFKEVHPTNGIYGDTTVQETDTTVQETDTTVQETDTTVQETNPANQEENESTVGDILNSVGSVSSTSTTSSVFSLHNHNTGPYPGSGVGLNTSLTPLTNTDSSPTGTNKSPPAHITHASRSSTHKSSAFNVPTTDEMELNTATLTPISSPGSIPLQARPGKGEAKGEKAVYDPELDKKLTSKEKKGRKVAYKTFGEEVWPMHDFMPTALYP